MAYQTPITIKQALESIQRQEYVLPAIQREFTWKPDQICGLFDSLMQGYPIGSLLFWQVEADRSADYKWYGFMREYHQRNNSHCDVLDLPSQGLVAILDGQQRLTSLNIGLRGSHAEKEPRKWWDNPEAFPTKHLYVNLLREADTNELGLKFDFKFLTPSRAEDDRGDGAHWFRVSDIWGFSSGKDVHRVLQRNEIGNHELAYDILYDLYAVVHEKPTLPYYVEREPDLDKVLNIFIRVNSAGTPLTYSDLLLSIATAQWKERDARAEIHGLVDELNETGGGFSLSKDLVLKAGLMLSDIPSVAFRVTNFTAANMVKLEQNWDDISAALRTAVRLLHAFGFSRQTLGADSVVIPIAYYLHTRGLGGSYVTAVGHREDRERLRGWVCRSLVKSGVWGSALDSLLLALRTALQSEVGSGFPAAALESEMAKKGKALRFGEDEVQDLLASAYHDKRTFALLALMYPFVDLANRVHVDHVFPKSRFTPARLRKAGVPEEQIDVLKAQVNLLPNLQLLEGSVNQSKLDKLPHQWLEEAFATDAARSNHCEIHDLGEVPEAVTEFAGFGDARRKRMEARLRKVLELNP